MIKKVTVTCHVNGSIVFDLRSPELSGFFIRGIDGLGPSKANINMSEALSLDGSRFNSARTTLRNIVFNLGFLEMPTIEDTRQLSYKHFPVKHEVDIIVETDNKTVKTTGYVESNEPDIFNKQEVSLVSVLCPDPYFYSLSKTIVNFSNVVSAFSFPFSNESLTEKLIIFGNILIDPQQNVYYSGEAHVGIKMYIHFLGPVTNLTVYNLSTRESMILDSDILVALTGFGFDAGDEVIISTIKGEKYVTLIRNGESINILNVLGPESNWFTLETGDNVFYYTADSGASNAQFRIEHDILYEGI